MVTDESGMGLRERRKAETRERIINAAVNCFSERGFNGASTRDIAKAAGVGQGLVTYHFESKESLWKAAVTQVCSTLPEARVSSAEQITSKAEAIDALHVFIQDMASQCLNEPNLAMFLYHQASQTDDKLTWMLDEHFIPALYSLQPIHEAAIREKAIKPLPFPVFAFSLLAIINTHFVLHNVYQHVAGEDPKQPEVADKLTQTILSMMII